MQENKYVVFQTQKMLSAYGGVGSIIESPKGALMIDDFDVWIFFKKGFYKEEEYQIKDNRLLNRLRTHFPNLISLARVPVNTPNPHKQDIPQDPSMIASATYFPRWFYCSSCGSFKHIKSWSEHWKATLRKHGYDNDSIRKYFIPPKCYVCNEKRVLSKKKKSFRFELEQVRFIMTAPNGSIDDIPWDKWTNAEKGMKENDEQPGTIRLQDRCCDNQSLRYLKSSKYADLAGIIIECANCKASNTLSGLFNLRLGKEVTKQFKPVIRTSNSVYYPLLITSIYLPKEEEFITAGDKELIDNLLKTNSDHSIIFEAFKSRYSKETLEKYIQEKIGNVGSDFENENSYRMKEYQFILGHPDFKDVIENSLTYEAQDASQLESFGIRKLIKIKRLKLTTVQVGYTRQEPLDKDALGNEGECKIRLKYTSKNGNRTAVLPAVESFGEGIFIEFDKGKLERWFSNNWGNENQFTSRLKRLQKNEFKNEYIVRKKFQDSISFYLAKFLVLHTFSHIIIKELEFLCGYPATSIQERLYIDPNQMQGVLIYTIAGSEGSYGGLISQANPDHFKNIIESALHRAGDCASDPVCYYSDDQGIGGLNLAACYSCALLPETSCEERNSCLDRGVLIDSQYGFMSWTK